MYLILFVLHDTNNLKAVLNAWDEAGVSGVTILPSTGLGRLRESKALQDDFPLIPRIEDFFHYEEQLNRTIFTIVRGEEMVDKVVQATENIVGDLRKPNTGILAVLPIVKVYGLNREPGV
ncbi:MAG: hypothetical protein IT308_04350 [Anaerolineaceae bacterium]|nr:hypothetical protein [Anaerolineaceae bacterium]